MTATPLSAEAISASIRVFLVDELGLREEEITAHAPLFSSGLLSSLDILRLVVFMDRAFGIRTSPFDISIERFDTVAQLNAHVLSRREQP